MWHLTNHKHIICPRITVDSLNKFKNLSILSETNNITNTIGTDLLSQESQDYYNWRDQQYIAWNYDGGLEQVNLESVPNIILEEEEEEGF